MKEKKWIGHRSEKRCSQSIEKNVGNKIATENKLPSEDSHLF